MRRIGVWVFLMLFITVVLFFLYRVGWHGSEEISGIIRGVNSDGYTSVEVPSTLGKSKIAADSLLSLAALPKPLSPSEVQRLGGWMRERGYLVDILESGASAISSASGYESMTDDELRRVAAFGDRTAAFILGKRLLERPEFEQSWPSKADMEEATHWLVHASFMGYTASLELLVELARKQAMLSRGDRRDRRISMELLNKAYIYAYVLEMRGDFSNGVQLDILKKVEQLSPDQENALRLEAVDIYSGWIQKRREIGYPPFENGIPADIVELYGRSLALNEAKKND